MAQRQQEEKPRTIRDAIREAVDELGMDAGWMEVQTYCVKQWGMDVSGSRPFFHQLRREQEQAAGETAVPSVSQRTDPPYAEAGGNGIETNIAQPPPAEGGTKLSVTDWIAAHRAVTGLVRIMGKDALLKIINSVNE